MCLVSVTLDPIIVKKKSVNVSLKKKKVLNRKKEKKRREVPYKMSREKSI